MGWINSLKGSVVGLDTAPLIYFTEANPNYTEVVDPFFKAIMREEFTAVSSIVTLLEVLVRPIQMATAIYAGATFFLTNDTSLPSLPKLKVLTLDTLKEYP